MISLFIWILMNGFIFHYDPNVISEQTKIIISVICIASDLNLFATISKK